MTVSATVVLDSISPAGKRLTTFQITAHRFILAEINTHRMLSRSYRSSRAVPSKRLIEEVRTNPAMPTHWGANRPGMQAREELDDSENVVGRLLTSRGLAQEEWRLAAFAAATRAEKLAATGLHKQVANRILEPFMWAHGVITATEWDNFFGLRLHEDAQPEFRALAEAMWTARKLSDPKLLEPGANWHLPYFEKEDWNLVADYAERTNQYDDYMMKEGGYSGSWGKDLAIKMSVARCARASLKSFDTDKRPTVEEDLNTYSKLNIPGTESYDPSRPIHASPAEHQATPDDVVGPFDVTVTPKKEDRLDADVSIVARWANPEQHGNFVGFRQYRKMFPGEAVAPFPEAYK